MKKAQGTLSKKILSQKLDIMGTDLPKSSSEFLLFHNKTKKIRAPLAQLVEQRTLNPLVPGSSPGWRTILFTRLSEAKISRQADFESWMAHHFFLSSRY